MPMIVFTYTAGALTQDRALGVAKQIRESMLRNHPIKSIKDGLREHTRLKVVEMPRGCYVLGDDDALPLYDVEVVGPIDSVAGKGAEAFAREVTTAILTAEGADVNDENGQRIWCVFNEVPDNKWSFGQKIMGRRSVLKQILRSQSRNGRQIQQAAE